MHIKFKENTLFSVWHDRQYRASWSNVFFRKTIFLLEHLVPPYIKIIKSITLQRDIKDRIY